MPPLRDGVTRANAARSRRNRARPGPAAARTGRQAGQAQQVRRATRGPTSTVSQRGAQTGAALRRKAPKRPTGVFTGRDFNSKGIPTQIARARRQTRNRAQKAATRTQAPLLPKFPVLPSYTPRQRDIIQNAALQAGRKALRQGVPIREVQKYLAQTHDQRTLEPYRRARRQNEQALKTRFGTKRGTASAAKPKGTFQKAQLATIGRANDRLNRQLGSISPAAVGLNVVGNVGQAFIEKPLKTGGNTLKGGAQIIAGIPAGVIAAITNPGDIPEQVRQDYIRRYGPLFQGRPAEFRNRIQQEGAAAEIVDVATVANPTGAVGGRAAMKGLKKFPKGSPAERFATAPRPKLRVSGGVAREQELSPNAIRAAAQRLEDRGRRKALERRNEKAARKSTPERPVTQRGLQPQGPNEVIPLRQKRAQRIEQSRRQSRAFQALRNEQGREIDAGARKSIGKLSKKQREAVVYALEGGVPLGKGAAPAKRALERHKAVILQNRTKANLPESTAELERIQYLIDNADDIFGQRGLADFHKREVERSRRIGENDPGVKTATAEVRRRRVQGELLGVRHEFDEMSDRLQKQREQALRRAPDSNARDKVKERFDEEEQVLKSLKPLLDERYIRRVDTKREAEGLPEPAYVHHYETAGAAAERRSARAIGGGNGAVAGVKQSRLSLFREGRRDTRALAYEQSLAEGIKRKHNWNLVADQADMHKLPDPSPEKIEKALGYVDRPENLTLREWQRILESEGIDPDDVAFWNPRRIRAARDTDGPDTGTLLQARSDDVPGLPSAVDEAGVRPTGKKGFRWLKEDERSLQSLSSEEADRFYKSKGWQLVPREAFNEIASATNPSGALGRGFDKIQGLQSAVLLGTSPGWLQAQIAANALLTGFAIKGKVNHLIEAPIWYRGLPEAQKRMADEAFGTGAMEAHGRGVHLGAAANGKVVNTWRMFKTTGAFRTAERLNPIRLMFRIDNAQNRYWRKVVLYNEVKKQAFRDLQTDGARVAESTDRVNKILALDPDKRLQRMLENPDVFEKHAQRVNDFLGDYVRFTARERRTFKRFVLFYGFFRYALRSLFYTVPVKHPVMGAVVAKLGQLHVEEVKELLGGDETPWAYSRLYFGEGDDMRSIDLARINPVGNPVVESVQAGPKSLGTAFMSPAVAITMNQLYGKDLFLQRGFRVGGNAAYNENPSIGARARIVLDDTLSLLAPYRIAKDATQRGTQGDDSLLGSPRPLKYKTSDARARERARREREPGLWGELVEGLLPFAPKADFTRQEAERRRRGSTSGRRSRPAPSNPDPLLQELEKLRSGSGGRDPLLDELDKLRAGG